MTIGNSWKRVIAGTLAMLVVAGTVPGDLGISGLFGGNSTSITAYAADPTTLAAETTTWGNGDYVVPTGGLTISGHITVNGTVNLTLPAGTTLTANTGITLSDGATLNVSGEGAMTVNGSNGNANSTVAGTGMLVLNSGTLTAKGGNGQGFGNAHDNGTGAAGGVAINGAVTVAGGTLNATGGNGGSIGKASDNNKGGAGGVAINGALSINGGSMTASKGNNGSVGAACRNSVGGVGGDSYGGTLTLGANVKLYEGTDDSGTVLDGNDSASRPYEGEKKASMYAYGPDIAQGPDKTALNEAITAAETLYNSIKDNNDYTDIASTLKTAIDNAKAVADSDEADQDAVDAAKGAVTTAKQTAETAKKDVDDTKAANAVIDKINALPASTDISTSDKTDIDAARAAYDALTDDQKAKVSPETLQKLEDTETALAAAEKDAADQAAADTATSTINDLPAADDVTTADKADIEAARAAYDALTADQKAKVSPETLKKLEDAEAALAAAEKDAADQAAADTAANTINDLPAADDVTTADKADIEAARAAYEALTADQKAKVTPETLKKLEDAEAALAAAEKEAADQAAADAAAEKISALPTPDKVTTEDKEAIEAARKAYDELTEDQKAKLPAGTKEKLEEAEEALAAVEKEAARIDISKAKVKVNNKTYTGKALKPGSKVIVNGKRLKKGRDYTVTYKNNKKVGFATAVIKGIGNYKGTVKTTFKVKPMKVSVKSISSPKAKKLKVTWKKVAQATGYNIKVSTNKNKFKGKALVKNVFAKRNGFVSKTFSGMKSGKTYYVKIRAYKQTKSGKIYGQYSAVKKIKVK